MKQYLVMMRSVERLHMISILLLGIFILLLAPITHAQDAPTDLPTATETLVPTATFTETPTPTLTETPTETPTATFTAIPTETPTATATATLAETATETPRATLAQTPLETAIASETPTVTPTPTLPSEEVSSFGSEGEVGILQVCNPNIPNPIPNGDVQCLRDAINAANSFCPTPTTINLAVNGVYTITDVVDTFLIVRFDNQNTSYGANGLPPIRCTVTINGNGSTIQRDPNAPAFRIMGVGNGGILTLNDVTITDGIATKNGGTGLEFAAGGAGLLNIGGYVTINRSRFLENTIAANEAPTLAIYGAGIYSYGGQLTLQYSEFADNANLNNPAGDGGGVAAVNVDFIRVVGSDFHDNSSSRNGHDLFAENFNPNPTVSFLNDSCIEQNTGIRVYANNINDPSIQLTASNNWWGTTNAAAIAAMVNKVNNISIAGGPIPCGPSAALTPTPTLTPSGSTYKYQLVSDGVLNWTSAETSAILAAIERTALALSLVPNAGGSQQDVFNRVMVDGDTLEFVLFVRGNSTSNINDGNPANNPSIPDIQVTITNPINRMIPYYDIYPGTCKTIQGTGSSQPISSAVPRSIICNGTLLNGIGTATEFTIVHELGHIFDNRSTVPTDNRGQLFRYVEQTGTQDCINPSTGLLTGFCITDTNLGIVMGTDRTGRWARGLRGWGSGPATSVTDFQQHPEGLFPGEDVTDETAADMFLNWVYRSTSPNVPPPYIQVPGTWQGFLNKQWRESNCQTANGCNDGTYPGDSRMVWMTPKILAIFTIKGW